MGRLSDRFDLEKQLVFYMSYHHNKINQWIHLVCIWPILITAVIMTAETKPFVDQPSFLADNAFGKLLVFNLSAIVAVIYMAWYVALDPKAGSLGAALVFVSYLFANWLAQNSPALFGVSAWVIALPIHLVAWTLQFIGHGVYERRKPALLDSLDQAIITAPMFVLFEVLFSVGYRPNLYRRVVAQVELNVAAFHGEKFLRENTPLLGPAA
ncbi:hypothetical protein PINS_up018356 [Pythium insidiosum]|nr:hypothetical protein PINS_up010331 [Pythium insidiosum]GLE07725.1 hypothetical protein PINS_up018356 [Pythium insidiosum]